MKQLSADKMLNIIEYEKVRSDYRKDIIDYKKHRRIKIGPNLAIVFENERTLSFQIQEIMRAERIVHDEKIQEEIDIYNSIMPPKNGLSATLFIEVTQEDQIKLAQAQAFEEKAEKERISRLNVYDRQHGEAYEKIHSLLLR